MIAMAVAQLMVGRAIVVVAVVVAAAAAHFDARTVGTLETVVIVDILRHHPTATLNTMTGQFRLRDRRSHERTVRTVSLRNVRTAVKDERGRIGVVRVAGRAADAAAP
jgi:hypothetical protein